MVYETRVIGITLIAALMLVAACSPAQEPSPQEPPAQGQQDPTQGQQDPTQGGDPTAILATVNGEEITREEVTGVQQSLSLQGGEVSEEEALEQVIGQIALTQQAQEEGYTPTVEETEAEIESQLEAQDMTLEDWRTQIESQGGSYDEQVEAVRQEFALQQYMNDNIQGETQQEQQASLDELMTQAREEADIQYN